MYNDRACGRARAFNPETRGFDSLLGRQIQTGTGEVEPGAWQLGLMKLWGRQSRPPNMRNQDITMT